MISIAEAEKIIDEQWLQPTSAMLQLKDCIAGILEDDIQADRPFPPFDRVAMDGIAISFAVWEAGQKQFKVGGIVKAGEAPSSLDDASQCLEVMTGAVLPPGTDCVIRYEDVDINDGCARLKEDLLLKPRQNVHGCGSDYQQGEQLLTAGTVIGPAQIAVLASVGKTQVKAKPMPRCAIVATGDELVPVDATPLPHQIRMSNLHALDTALEACGIHHRQCVVLRDDKTEMLNKMEQLIRDNDLLILSGGVSMGKYDFVPEVMRELSVCEHFHKVALRPGKPLWFGSHAEHGTMIFGLPGNPVSALIGFYRFLAPRLNHHYQPRRIELAEDASFKPPLTWFRPVCVKQNKAWLAAVNGSGDLCGLALSDGFIELPADQDQFKAGIKAPFYPF